MFRPEKTGSILQLTSHGHGYPEIARSFAQTSKLRLRYADYLERVTTNRESSSDNVRVAAKLVLPGGVTKHHYRLASGCERVCRNQWSSGEGVHPKHLEVIAGNQLTEKWTTFNASKKKLQADDLGKRWIAVPKGLELWPRERVLGAALVCPGISIQTVGIANRDWAKNVGVEDCKK